MYQLPTSNSRAQATIGGVGRVPPSLTTSSSELSWPDRSSTIDSSISGAASESGSNSSIDSSRSISSLSRSFGITAALAVKAAASALFSAWMRSSCRATLMFDEAMPSRRRLSSGGRRRSTSARSSRVTLALADQISSEAAFFSDLISALWRP